MNEGYQEIVSDETEELSPEQLRMLSSCRFGGRVVAPNGESLENDWVFMGRKGGEVYVAKLDGTQHKTIPVGDFLALNSNE